MSPVPLSPLPLIPDDRLDRKQQLRVLRSFTSFFIHVDAADSTARLNCLGLLQSLLRPPQGRTWVQYSFFRQWVATLPSMLLGKGANNVRITRLALSLLSSVGRYYSDAVDFDSLQPKLLPVLSCLCSIGSSELQIELLDSCIWNFQHIKPSLLKALLACTRNQENPLPVNVQSHLVELILLCHTRNKSVSLSSLLSFLLSIALSSVTAITTTATTATTTTSAVSTAPWNSTAGNAVLDAVCSSLASVRSNLTTRTDASHSNTGKADVADSLLRCPPGLDGSYWLLAIVAPAIAKALPEAKQGNPNPSSFYQTLDILLKILHVSAPSASTSNSTTPSSTKSVWADPATPAFTSLFAPIIPALLEFLLHITDHQTPHGSAEKGSFGVCVSLLTSIPNLLNHLLSFWLNHAQDARTVACLLALLRAPRLRRLLLEEDITNIALDLLQTILESGSGAVVENAKVSALRSEFVLLYGE